ncbi:MAG: alpha/beta hydrolase [Anaerolineae bacterium]
MDTFDRFYGAVPIEQRERLHQFRQQHPTHRAQVGELEWEYLTGGSGDEVILLLVGGLRVADAGFRSMTELERTFRVINPTYPRALTMSQLCDGLIGLLAAAGVTQAHVLAGSFGGMVAQALVRLYPQSVKSLILSNTAVLDETAAARYRSELDMITPIPPELVREGAKDRFYHMVAPPEDESVFWRAYLDELFTVRLDKDDLLSTYHCLLDFAAHFTLTPIDQPRTLIIESSDDATFDQKQRDAVKNLYPHAQVYTFQSAGHSAATTQRDTYFQVVREFISASAES